VVSKGRERAEFEKGGSGLFVRHVGNEASGLLVKGGGGISEKSVDEKGGA
jgi:hypothetical protein